MKIKNSKFGLIALFVIFLSLVYSCEENNLPEIGSVEDLTPPEANFSATANKGDWQTIEFSNQSVSATTFAWEFGDGNSSTDKEPFNKYAAEGTYNVTLTASDNNGVTSKFTSSVDVVKPAVVVIPDPKLINADFVKTAKSSGSDCACSGWINKSLGDQGESSSGNGSDVVKFDNNEPDHIYQEFEVTPNADYTITIITQFKPSAGGTYASQLNMRILAGSGYTSGYTPVYYTATDAFPQDGYGYASIAQVEDATNNLLNETLNNPGDDSYLSNTYTFNAGNNTSVAFFMRGVGGDSSVGNFGYTSGDEEIRLDSVTITAN
ncbi:PKD domain-containing protein [Polaribacter porphyrae]|uniref:PKD domain-containing protein n=1 Tax=Polaribacter porphyrae TaxID=1137780 RepID=A0A2S7WQ50_9FLAO|nr:PKD domain-containing protein [Polaribacter porphyrae]PQJ79729.1 PKD domain-containing protein [Polaribacter porphyrae]